MQPVSAMMGGAEIELSACVGMGVARADSTGAGRASSKSDSTSKGLAEAKRECVIGGGSRRRLCCVCVLGMRGGGAKIEGETYMVTRGEDQVRDEASRTRVLLPSDFESIRDALILCAELALVSSWGWCVCPSDCSLKETIVVGLERVSSWGHERGPSACSSK